MLLAKAKSLVEIGRALIVAGKVRLLDPTGAGYQRAPDVLRYAGSCSYDPDFGGGPTVLQAKGRVYR